AASFLQERAGESEALTIAEHFERAGEGRQAVSWYRRAAEQALEGCDAAAALLRAERGLASGALGEERGRLLLLLAEARKWRGESAEAEAQALSAMQWLPWGSALWYTAVAEAITAGSVHDHHDRVV